MNSHDQRIWAYSILFLSIFRPLQYNRVSLNMLLFRDFQRFYKKHAKRLPRTSVRPVSPRKLHLSCAPYLRYKTPQMCNPDGYTLIRANLYSVVHNIRQERVIFLAHTRKEMITMRKIAGCRPLIYLPKLKPVSNIKGRQRVLKQLATIYRSRRTPRLFKTALFRKWMQQKLHRAIRRLARIHRLFKQYPIKQTLYGSTLNHHGSTVSCFAQSRGIPTINLQHGIFGIFGHLPANADWNIVWGRAHANFLMKHGVPKEKIKIVGPFFARSLNPLQGKIKQLRSSSLTILVATQPIGLRRNRQLFHAVETAVQTIGKGVTVYYKLHPDQRKSTNYERFIRRDSSKVIPHGSISLQHLLATADVVITPFSTVGYEALTQNKPVFFFGNRTSLYYMSGRPVCFRSGHELSKLLKSFRHPIKSQKLIANMRLKDRTNDSSSNQSVWKVINEFREEGFINDDDTSTFIASNSDHSCEERVKRVAEQKQEIIQREATDCPHD